MVEGDAQHLEACLRQHTVHYLQERSPWRLPLATALGRLPGPARPLYLFGGLLRDLLIFGVDTSPRDVDLVIGGNTTTDELEAALAPYLDRRTRFGGLQLVVEGVAVDIWPLQETWAFQHLGVPSPTFADLPRTTFLDVEAVVLELFVEQGTVGKLHAFGFFEAILTGTLDINLEDNPSPGLCVVRSLGLADRLGFAIGPRLTEYLSHRLGRMSVDELVALQAANSGCVRCSREAVQRWKEGFTSTCVAPRVAQNLPRGCTTTLQSSKVGQVLPGSPSSATSGP